MDQHTVNNGDLQIRFLGQITASVSICSVTDEAAQTRTTPVLLDKMSLEGLEFQTHLRFPVNSDYTIRIETVVGPWELSLLGHIVWRRRKDNLYAYGCTFVPDDYMRKAIKLALQSYVKQLHPNYRRIHQLYERMSGGAAVAHRLYKFDQKG
ncbi:PilZ domain-containing protein [Paenibacillus rhizovicinus]|uniref:PilZ domain-containing protein n=1 Tax=Paenibacillus rhizovicinus TaxID=2704463 RepID=A0A6C0NXD6_9BACL|nr:PilZ domain-containing protein [Paenibacillus rhizovicinus]QHW30848.1 PilZ domain-containing protein [Paenibacillus rhizovicinus]